jgi:hypothetical protein
MDPERKGVVAPCIAIVDEADIPDSVDVLP